MKLISESLKINEAKFDLKYIKIIPYLPGTNMYCIPLSHKTAFDVLISSLNIIYDFMDQPTE